MAVATPNRLHRATHARLPSREMTDAPPLPGVLAEIEEIAGREAAVNFALGFHGRRVAVPQSLDTSAGREIEDAVGAAAARMIVERFRGDSIYVRQVTRFLVVELTARGMRTSDIGRRLGITDRAVQKHRRANMFA